MKKSRLTVLILLGVFIAAGMSGCIVSASPNPNQVIEMKPGDKVVFKVFGPMNTPTTRCVWSIKNDYNNEVVSVGKNEYELDFNADSKLSNKENIIACEYEIYLFTECGQGCNPHWQWVRTTISREWKVRTNPNSATVITGDYYIYNISDLQFLKGYTTVTGSLIIYADIKTLEGLDKLTTIGGYLTISGNGYIKDLTGLENLTSVGGDLSIKNNPALTSLSGLENLTSVGGDLSIENNPALTSLSCLENITSVGGYLRIWSNLVLTSLSGLDNIKPVVGLDIYSNAALTSLSGLEKITAILGDLDIMDNSGLTSLTGLHNLGTIGGSLRFGDVYGGNTALASLSALGNLTSIGEYFEIEGCSALTSLSGLENITSIPEGLIIRYNDHLISLTGLENLTSVGGPLYIGHNDELTSLTSLENVTSVGGTLTIEFNNVLMSLGMEGLKRVGGDFEIDNNSQLCDQLAKDLMAQVMSREGIGGWKYISNKVCTMP